MSTSSTATQPVDLVIVIDTSLSMSDEAEALSQALNAAVEEAKSACPSDLRVKFLGIEGTFDNSDFNETVRQYLTGIGVDGGTLKGRILDSVERAGAQEDVARAVEDVSRYYDWRPGAERNLFVLGDESMEGGDMVLNPERIQACTSAIATAVQNKVKVHTYLGTPYASDPYPTPADEEAMIKEYRRLALRTGGEDYIYTRGVADFTQVLKQTICASRVPQEQSIADKQKEADKLEGIESGGNICDHAAEIIKAVNTLAGVLDKLVDICGPGGGKGGCRCHEHEKEDAGKGEC
ncbi:VWA domain-containing protein [Enterobacteriaceae bacterium BIT-l23]|uniref:VWA domain-containing protein n=1 Tax=Jejubacter sp. L23 TaxID=3092086 RepID=UPI0015854F89|nr:VWA domain-containing protein [Enterobacteriaceae bacterium BIT-l23]